MSSSLGGNGWQRLCQSSDLCLELTLNCGQAFGWKKIEHSSKENQVIKKENHQDDVQKTSWVGMVNNKWVVELQTQDTDVLYRSISKSESTTATFSNLHAALEDYFQLQFSLPSLYNEWCHSNDNEKQDFISQTMQCLPGLRLMRQDPVECLFSFICSSNNNISRITLMLGRLRERSGLKVNENFFTFPDVEALCELSEKELRDMGFGYRARFVSETAALLKTLGGESFLYELRNKEDAESVREALVQFTGIGSKVADCIALFSLDQLDAIPVDTHVRQIAARYFDPSLNQSKSVTPTIYQNVGDAFRKRFPKHAGWAHSVLFAAELPLFRTKLSKDVRDKIERHQNRAKKAKKKRKANDQ